MSSRNGDYLFSDVTPGDYTIIQTNDTDYTDVTDVEGPNDSQITVSVSNGESVVDQNFVDELSASITGNVTSDDNNDDVGDSNLSGIIITLVDSNGNSVISTTTDSNGDYLFSDVTPGEYNIIQTNETGYTDVNDVEGANDSQIAVSVSNGESQDVVLGLIDSNGNTIATTATNIDGNYEFTDVIPGEYNVKEIQPAGFISVSEVDGGDDLDHGDNNIVDNIPVTVDAGTVDSGNNFVEEEFANITGNVASDTDNDGIGNTNLSGVVISLFDSVGTTIATTVTDANGNYQFSELSPGIYDIVQTQPSDFDNVSDTQGANDNQVRVNLAPGETSSNNDFVEEPLPGTLAGRVWEDSDRNGLEGGLESGISNVNVTLTSGGADGLISTPGDNTTQTITTDSNGEYQFTELTPEIEYQVSVDINTFPAEYTDGLTSQDTGSDDQIDSDADINTGLTPVVTLSPGESQTDIDAGLLKPEDKLIEGTASPDTIVGSSDSETIAGYKGQDTLTGGDGNDLFFFNETSDGVDVITDFTSGEDQIHLTQILEDELGYIGNDPIADGHVVIADYGSAGTMVQINFDGTNNLLPKDVAFLEGVSNLDNNSNNDFDPNTDLAF